MDTPGLYKRRNNLHPKDKDAASKVLVKTNAASLVSSAKESLKQLQINKAQFHSKRKLSQNNLKENSISKFHSPLLPDTREILSPEEFSLVKTNSAVDSFKTHTVNIGFLEDLDKFNVPRRVTVDSSDHHYQQRMVKQEAKPVANNHAKNSTKAFIIRHVRGNSNETRKFSVSSTQSTEISKDGHSKPSTAEEKAVPTPSPQVEIIAEERKSECSSLSSNKAAGIGDQNNTGESSIYTMKFEESTERRGEFSSEVEEVALPVEMKRRPMKSNTILKKEGLASFDVKLGEMIGEGAYGRVYKALNMETGKFLAVKEISMEEPEAKPALNVGTLCQEIEVYQKLEHENIVSYLGAKQEGLDAYIYMEYMPGGSISSMLKQYGSFEEKVIKKFTKQVAEGLNYLHAKGVIHRDIKGGNILSDAAGNVKLADFGAAKHIDYLPFVASVSSSEMCNSMKGSLFWMAPELINGKKHGRKIDIWSLGCTVIEMATARHPWPNVKDYTGLVIAMMNQKCPPIPDNLSDCAQDFIRQCCQFDKKLRPRIQQLLQHPFLKDTENS